MPYDYEELHGALGRRSQYRPERYRARDIFSLESRPELVNGHGSYPVLDLSSNGVCMLAPHDPDRWVLGDRVDLQLRLHGQDQQRLYARIVRVEPRGRHVRVGLGLERSFLDVDRALAFDRNRRFISGLTAGPDAHIKRVPSEFKAVVAEIAYLIQHYQRQVAPHEADARRQGEDAVQQLGDDVYRSIGPRYDVLRKAAARAIRDHLGDPETLRAAKEYVETAITQLVISAPVVSRAYGKPLGYPGDYQVMLYSYADALEGETAFAKAMHRLYTRHPLSAGVCTRKDLVVDHIAGHLAERARHVDDYHVMSLGCGPAREVSELLQRLPDVRTPLHFRLVDQEARALEIAHREIQREIARIDNDVTLRCLNLGFSRLLADPSLMAVKRPSDFIYCTGLFDYLKEPLAAQLTAVLYQQLAPGGELLIGNAAAPNEDFFCMEFVVDWPLIYRTREEMLRLTALLPDAAPRNISRERGAAYYFLSLRKPVE